MLTHPQKAMPRRTAQGLPVRWAHGRAGLPLLFTVDSYQGAGGALAHLGQDTGFSARGCQNPEDWEDQGEDGQDAVHLGEREPHGQLPRAASPQQGGHGFPAPESFPEWQGTAVGVRKGAREAGVLKLKPGGPLGCREGGAVTDKRTQPPGKEESMTEEGRVVTCSRRRVYCQEVTPGAFSMKRRPLVKRKLAC